MLCQVRSFSTRSPSAQKPEAELTFYYQNTRLLYGGNGVTKYMTPVWALRGAKVRDALKWSGYIEEARNEYSMMLISTGR